MSGKEGVRRAAYVLMLAALAAGCGGESAPELVIPGPALENAEPELRRVIEQAQNEVRENPDSAETWGRLGDRYRAHLWVVEAAECYQRAEELDPDNFLWPYLLGKSVRLNEPALAADAFARALALDPGYAPAHLFAGHTLVQLGRFDEARARFEDARELDPTHAGAHLGLGQLALGDNEFEKAHELLTRAFELDPNDGRIQLALAQAAVAIGDPAEAARLAASARQLGQSGIDDPRAEPTVEPAGSWGTAKRGRELLAQGKPEEAERYLKEATHINPDNEGVQIALGLSLIVQKKLDEAEPHLRRALELNPDNSEAHATLANLLLMRDGPGNEEALEYLRSAITLAPQDADSHYRLGRVLADRGELDEAESALKEAIRVNPDLVDAHYRLGLVLASKGGLEEAYGSFEAVLRIAHRSIQKIDKEIGPPDADGNRAVDEQQQARIQKIARSTSDSHYNMGLLRARVGDIDDAMRHLAEAVRIRPDNADAHVRIGQALLARGMLDDADKAFRRALAIRPGWDEAERGLADLEARR